MTQRDRVSIDPSTQRISNLFLSEKCECVQILD
jgi:hypothetical protein